MNSEYKKALQGSPIWVRMAYWSYRLLPKSIRDRRPFLYHLTGGLSTPAFKMGSRKSRYTDLSKTEGQQCANCIFAYQKVKTGKYICSQIRIGIKPEGWCKLWKA